MAPKSKQNAGMSPLAALVLIAAAAIVFATVFQRPAAPPKATVTPPIRVEPKDPTSQEFMKRIREAAKQTRGDWARLPFEDQRLLDGYSAGHGRTMFEMMAKEEAEKAKPSPSKKK